MKLVSLFCDYTCYPCPICKLRNKRKYSFWDLTLKWTHFLKVCCLKNSAGSEPILHHNNVSSLSLKKSIKNLHFLKVKPFQVWFCHKTHNQTSFYSFLSVVYCNMVEAYSRARHVRCRHGGCLTDRSSSVDPTGRCR